MHFRPTSASRLNMVERIFRDITGWRPSGLKTRSTAAHDIKGRTLNGAQSGIIHRFRFAAPEIMLRPSL